MGDGDRYLTVHFGSINPAQRLELLGLGNRLGQREDYKVDFTPSSDEGHPEIWDGRGFVIGYKNCLSFFQRELALPVR